MPSERRYAQVNGLRMYYEVHGEGPPLVLVHGSFLTIDLAFGALIPELAKSRRVIAVELQGHGRTADIDRPFAFESLADDLAELMRLLGVGLADVLGYSLGATVALQVAARHRALVRKLVVVSAVFKYDGWSAETQAAFARVTPETFEGSPIKIEYDRLAPDPSHWPRLVERLLRLIRSHYDFCGLAASLRSPTLIVLGDSDGVRPEHAVEMFRLRGGWVMGDLVGMPDSQLAILPGASHVGVMGRTDLLLAIVSAFLDAPQTQSRSR